MGWSLWHRWQVAYEQRKCTWALSQVLWGCSAHLSFRWAWPHYVTTAGAQLWWHGKWRDLLTLNAFIWLLLLMRGVARSQWCCWSTSQHPSAGSPEGQVPTCNCRTWKGFVHVPGKLWRIRTSFWAKRWELLPIYCAGKSRSWSLVANESSLDGKRSSDTRPVCFTGTGDSKAVLSSNDFFLLGCTFQKQVLGRLKIEKVRQCCLIFPSPNPGNTLWSGRLTPSSSSHYSDSVTQWTLA